MRWEHRVDADAAAWDGIVAQLERRPATWLRPFLLLATPGARNGTERTRRVWVRVGPPTDGAAPIWWRPSGSGEPFDRFVGELGARRDGDQMWFWIEGTASGGSEAGTDRTLRLLVSLLATALGGVTSPGTG